MRLAVAWVLLAGACGYGTSGPETESDTGMEITNCERVRATGLRKVAPFTLWFPDEEQRSLLRFDTELQQVVAEYTLLDAGTHAMSAVVSPSGRYVAVVTSDVDPSGDGEVFLVAASQSDCVDKNLDGKIDTAQLGGEPLASGTDECVLWRATVPSGLFAELAPHTAVWRFGSFDAGTCEVGQPELWVAYFSDPLNLVLARFDLSNGTEHDVQLVEGWRDDRFGPRVMLADRSQRIWMQSRAQDRYIIDPRSGSQVRELGPPVEEVPPLALALTIDPRGGLWSGFASGPLYFRDPEASTDVPLSFDYDNHQGVVFTSFGEGWIAANSIHGERLLYLALDNHVQVFSLPDAQEVGSIAVDPHDNLWVLGRSKYMWHVQARLDDPHAFSINAIAVPGEREHGSLMNATYWDFFVDWD